MVEERNQLHKQCSDLHTYTVVRTHMHTYMRMYTQTQTHTHSKSNKAFFKQKQRNTTNVKLLLQMSILNVYNFITLYRLWICLTQCMFIYLQVFYNKIYKIKKYKVLFSSFSESDPRPGGRGGTPLITALGRQRPAQSTRARFRTGTNTTERNPDS